MTPTTPPAAGACSTSPGWTCWGTFTGPGGVRACLPDSGRRRRQPGSPGVRRAAPVRTAGSRESRARAPRSRGLGSGSRAVRDAADPAAAQRVRAFRTCPGLGAEWRPGAGLTGLPRVPRTLGTPPTRSSKPYNGPATGWRGIDRFLHFGAGWTTVTKKAGRMEYRRFGKTDMELSTIALGGLLAHYEGFVEHPPPGEKRAIYLRARELGVNLFDMGYGDEVHIPDELRGPGGDHHFSLKVGGAAARPARRDRRPAPGQHPAGPDRHPAGAPSRLPGVTRTGRAH